MQDKKIVIYVTSWCAYCQQAKAYFMDRNIDFVEKNIEEDPVANQELVEKVSGRFRGVPVIDINGEILQGFNRAEIDAAIAKMSQG